MENEIDKLFAQKLAQHRQEPSRRALERFNERLDERESKKIFFFLSWSKNAKFYYGTAAGVAIVLSVLSYGVFKKPQNIEQPLTSVENPLKNIEAPTLNQNITKSTQAIKQPSAQLALKSKVRTFATELMPKVVKKENLRQVIEPIEQQENEPQIFAKNDLKLIDNQGLNPKTIINQAIVNEPKINQNDVVLVLSETPTANSVVANIKPVSEKKVEADESDEPFLKRFWAELKHLKNGEKVDLKLLRTKPKEIIARANESLFKEDREDGRESWQRLRERVSKREN